jgi:hypothetical protein
MNMKLCILKMTSNEFMVKWVYEFINLCKSSCCAFFFPYLPWRFGKGIGKHMSICLVDECIACRNPSFGLATKAKGLQGCGPRGNPGVTSETPRNVGECEGVSHHTPKATPALGKGVPVDSRNFKDRFEGSKLNGLWCSLYH